MEWFQTIHRFAQVKLFVLMKTLANVMTVSVENSVNLQNATTPLPMKLRFAMEEVHATMWILVFVKVDMEENSVNLQNVMAFFPMRLLVSVMLMVPVKQ